MVYTTHGLMTPADLADHQQLTDTGIHPGCGGHYEDPILTYCSVADECPGDDYNEQVGQPGAPMETYSRMSLYQASGGHHRLTPRQRRRVVQKAARGGWHTYLDKRGVKQLAF